jgi:23S rRNA pseudouridine1911/1915/1917 synthase
VTSSQEENFKAGAALEGERVDSAVSLIAGVTRSMAQRLLCEGLVSVNGRPCAKSLRIKQGDRVRVTLPEPKPPETLPQDIPLDIVYEDDDVIVVNKPRGMVVHPAPGNYDGTLVNALLSHCGGSLSGINGVMRPGIVHRIDKDTSGLLLVAKNDRAHLSLAAQLKAHSMKRVYEAVVRGVLKNDRGTIDAPIGRHPVQRKRMAVTDKNSKFAVTHYEVIARYEKYTYVRLRLETGRTHQIRVHMAYIGHPVAGDAVYGGAPAKPEEAGLDGQCLHARVIGFVHPATGMYMEFSSELPEYFTGFLSRLQN